MKLSITLTILFANFATTTPNLCENVYLDANDQPITDARGQTFSRYCEWTGPDAPVWDANVCCIFDERGAYCMELEREASCDVGLEMYCEYGAAVSGGGVVCYQPLPSMCDEGMCITGAQPPATAQATLGCCGSGGACQPIVEDLWEMCTEGGGSVIWCSDGVTNLNGTIDCWD